MQASIMQSPLWAEFKKSHGWTPHQSLGLSVLERPVRLGRSFLYVPEITIEDGLASTAAKAIAALQHHKGTGTIFGRAEFMAPYSEHADRVLHQAGLRKAADEVQPEYRQEIDLSPMLKDIRAQMKQKGRYNVGVAERHGVEVMTDGSEAAVNEFVHIHHATASRKKYAGRSSAYLRQLIGLLHQEGLGGLWVARYQGMVLAGVIVSFYHDRASYLYGASSSEHRNVMAPYLLHFGIIDEAKRRGCTVYDMIGVAPPEAPLDHPWSGISRFKREFGGETVRYLGSYDRVYSPLWYKAYSLMRGKQ